jgi:hypothetical protein
VQRHVLYLGEINDTQELAWRKSIAVLEEGAAEPRALALFPLGGLDFTDKLLHDDCWEQRWEIHPSQHGSASPPRPLGTPFLSGDRDRCACYTGNSHA